MKNIFLHTEHPKCVILYEGRKSKQKMNMIENLYYGIYYREVVYGCPILKKNENSNSQGDRGIDLMRNRHVVIRVK